MLKFSWHWHWGRSSTCWIMHRLLLRLKGGVWWGFDAYSNTLFLTWTKLWWICGRTWSLLKSFLKRQTHIKASCKYNMWNLSFCWKQLNQRRIFRIRSCVVQPSLGWVNWIRNLTTSIKYNCWHLRNCQRVIQSILWSNETRAFEGNAVLSRHQRLIWLGWDMTD